MKNSFSRRFVLKGFGAAAAVSMFGCHAKGETKIVRPLRVSWDSFWFSSYIAKTGLEQLGYTVKDPIVMSPAALYQALSQGDGDFTMDVVMPGATAQYNAVKDSVNLLGPVVKPGSVTGYLIDKKTSVANDIRYVTDFQKPEIAALFSDGTDKRAKLIGPGAGFGDEKRAISDIARLGLTNTVNLVIGDYNLLVADVVSRYRAGKPVFLYAWFPNTATVELMPGTDLVFLEERNANPAFTFRDVPGCASGQMVCNTGWSPTTYYIGANKSWIGKNPKAAAFFSALRISTQDRINQNMLMAKGEKNESDLARHAADWIKANQQNFNDAVAKGQNA